MLRRFRQTHTQIQQTERRREMRMHIASEGLTQHLGRPIIPHPQVALNHEQSCPEQWLQEVSSDIFQAEENGMFRARPVMR